MHFSVTPSNSAEIVSETAAQLLSYCEKNAWAGYDPYDALNSRLFAATPFSKSRICRIVFTQVMKRLPINLRPFLLVPKTENPKALAIFLMALVKLSGLGFSGQERNIQWMIDRLAALRSENTPYWCWGYSFPWQTRTILVPRGAPNLVCTTFVANALLDAYESMGDPRCLRMAASTGEYILNELYWQEGDSLSGFSYPVPESRSRVHNANFLGAALLCRVSKYTEEDKFLEPALKVARYSASRQQEDGSWAYGELPTQQWVDNFHTGYNLCALRDISRYAGTSEFDSHIRLGFEFYLGHFFTEDFAPKYFHNSTYPIDSHCAAQSIITLVAFRDLGEGSIDLAHSVFRWARQHLWTKDEYFYYQATPLYTNRISFMRWTQAWMLLALAVLFETHQAPLN